MSRRDQLITHLQNSLLKKSEDEAKYLELISDLLAENAELKREYLIATGKYYEDPQVEVTGFLNSDGTFAQYFRG